jgi:curli biogenesis system outer membrane secretion channel CsgG
MKNVQTNFASRTLLLIVCGLFCFSCAATDKSTQPASKTAPSGGPTIDQALTEDYAGPRARVAVATFVDRSAKGKETGQIGDGMTEMLANALSATNRYIVLECQTLDQCITTGTSAQAGETEAADLLIEGTINEFEPGTTEVGSGWADLLPRRTGSWGKILVDFLSGIKTSRVALMLKMTDARTGRTLTSKQIEGRATDVGGIAGTGGDSSGLTGFFDSYSKTPMEKAIRIAVDEAVKFIVVKTPAEYYRVLPSPPEKPAPATADKPSETIRPSPPTRTPPKEPVTASLPPRTPPATQQPALRTAKVTAIPDENLRDGPGGKIIGKVKKDTSLTILEEKENWLRVRLEDGTESWIWKASTSEAPKSSPPAPPKKKDVSPM